MRGADLMRDESIQGILPLVQHMTSRSTEEA